MADPSRQPDPDRLLQIARRGDQQALGELLEQYRPYLSLLARLRADRQLHSKLSDSDLVQDACLSAHRDFHQFLGHTEPEFTTWLRQIVAHVAANNARDHRRGRRDVRLERQLYDHLNQSSQMMERALTAPDSSPSEKAVRRERAVLLANALRQLPADYREVLIMRELEGKSLADVARQLGRTTNAVQKLWARALVQMRRHMQCSPELS